MGKAAAFPAHLMKFLCLFVRLAVSVVLLVAQCHAAVLVPTSSIWRWQPGIKEASAPVNLWREVSFADAQFTTAPAPFWYGDVLPGGTQISGMQNAYTCIFLRKTFVLTNLTEIGRLRMGSLVDDGFVAWINGTEVLRVGMSGAAGEVVATNTLALNALEPVSFTVNDLPAPPSYLVLGTNVLAVQVFQSSLASSDLGFDCSLESVVTETNPPVVVSPNPLPGTVTHLSQITIRFSEPVTGVAAAHLLVNGIGATGVMAIDSSTYTFSFVQPPYGTVVVGWSGSHAIFDLASVPNRFNEDGIGWTYNLMDTTPPEILALTPSDSATVRALTSIVVLFTEPVSGVDATDLLINNTHATSVIQVGDIEYIFAFPAPPTGAVQVAWSVGHGIVDRALPPNAFPGGSWTYRLDPNASETPLYISEFMASNTRVTGTGSLIDEDGDASDWIEIYNPTSGAVNLGGWYLTDSAGDPTKWRFPETNLAGGGFLVVFASGKDRTKSGTRLHTSFQLSAGGEYLALVQPDGITIASQYAPLYPKQVPDVSFGPAQSGLPPGYTTNAGRVYFTTPTPGSVNLGGAAVPGPVIEEVRHTPNVPLDHEDLLVTARVRRSFRAIDSVTMRYRVMFGDELATSMFDDGAHGDGAAGDGLYGATIPADLSTSGEMIRYFIVATDVNTNTSRWPLFTSSTATEEYLGTIVSPTNLTSKLPIFHLFVGPTQLAGIDSESGGRLSFFYDGEFYDNVYMELRGNTSAGLNKKSHRLEFNRGHELRHAGPGPRTRKSSLLAEYLDPAYLRQHLCFWFLNSIGVPSPFHYPVRVQMNGRFHSLAFHNDVIGQEQIERMGYDPKGALYKAVGNLVPGFASTGVFQKLEPDNDPSRADYLELADGIGEASSTAVRRNTVFDLLDLPQVINHLAGTRWCSENDDVWANMSIYRDTFGDGLWRCIPFDMNASWGQLYGGSDPLEATVDSSKSHPLYGGSSTGDNYNRLYDVIVALPETRQMLLRRERSIMDLMVQPPSTPAASLILENHIAYMTNQIAAEAALDRARWGDSPWAQGKTFASGVDNLIKQFVKPRRQHWYRTHSITNTARAIGVGNANNAGIPLSQQLNTSFVIVGVDFNPTGGNQQQEYVCISNTAPFAIDITGWKVVGGINFTFAPGTVLPSNGVAYVSPNTRSFRSRTSGPRGGQGLFVLGPYQGQLSARGETLEVRNQLGLTVGSYSYKGAPTPAQQFLRITEIMYHPTGLAGNPLPPDEFEYIELKNISTNTLLDLNGVRLVTGTQFSFTGSAITNLAPGASVLVVKNAFAFTARYGGGLPVAGQYTGNLDNDGERVQLFDPTGEEILDFTYHDDWYPITDGLGFSLVIVDETAEADAWSRNSQWSPGVALSGSPGGPDPVQTAIPPVLITEVLTRSDVPPPLDTIELHNPTDRPVDISGWWLTDDFNTPLKFLIPADTTIEANGYVAFSESQFNLVDTGFGLSSDGDEVWLFSATATPTNLTGYSHGHRFAAADDGVSFGRHVTSDGKEHFVAQTLTSFGTNNVGPRVGPVVIDEIMYHPPDLNGTTNNRAEEYVALHNIMPDEVPLFDTNFLTNVWRLRGGVDFDFPANVILTGGEHILLVGFSPTNGPISSAFRARYEVKDSVRLFGPYSGNLDNSKADVELKKPATPVLGFVPYVLVDQVEYSDSAPWPVGADGFGLSLQRRDSTAYGNDPANWIAAPPNPAEPTTLGVIPSITTQPQSQTSVAYQPVSFSVAARDGAALRYQWHLNGAPLAGATNSLLTLGSAQPEQAGQYNVLVFNPAGSVISANASLTLRYPADLITQPASVAARLGNNVTIGVTAFSGEPLGYQWRKNGVIIPGANSRDLILPNVQFSDEADYTVVISDNIRPLTSTPARLTILVEPAITENPVSLEIVPGARVVLSVAVTNIATLPVGYFLRRNNAIVPSSIPGSSMTLNEHTAYIVLSGTNTMPPWTNYSFLVTNQAQPGGRLSASANLVFLTDTDLDGLPDDWETKYFGLAGADPNTDSDGDGLTNGQEYTAGTDPTDARSYLKVHSITANGGATLVFGTLAGKTYTVQYSRGLGSRTWNKLADVPARSANQLETLLDAGFTTNRYYRLVTPRQP